MKTKVLKKQQGFKVVYIAYLLAASATAYFLLQRQSDLYDCASAIAEYDQANQAPAIPSNYRYYAIKLAKRNLACEKAPTELTKSFVTQRQEVISLAAQEDVIAEAKASLEKNQ